MKSEVIKLKISKDERKRRVIDSALTIEDVYSNPNFAMDFVISHLDGEHEGIKNLVSDRFYYILEGSAVVSIGDRVFQAGIHDLLVIPKGTVHGIKGSAVFAVITSPPFSPENEITVQKS